MYAVTGATGLLGRLVIETLLASVEGGKIVALVRDPGKAADLAALGVIVRTADYDQPDTLPSALGGVERLLLISGNEPGRRLAQHQAVIDAAVKAGVQLIAYTSILQGDRSPLVLAADHKATELALAASGLPTILLRNGWYTENYLGSLPQALEHGAFVGAAKDGKISTATRLDYAQAAAAALLATGLESQTFELAGDSAHTLTELADEVSRQSGKPVVYRDLSKAEYEAFLQSVGLPQPIAGILADAEAAAAEGALFDDGGDLSRLIGRPTTPLSQAVATALGA